MSHLKKYFEKFARFEEPSTNPFFLSHIFFIGEMTQGCLLVREPPTGLYFPAIDWARRGELAIAVACQFLNLRYNELCSNRECEELEFLFIRASLTMCSQFWTVPEFAGVSGGKVLDYFNELYPISNQYQHDIQKMTGLLGQEARRLDGGTSDAMPSFARVCRGLFYQLLRECA